MSEEINEAYEKMSEKIALNFEVVFSKRLFSNFFVGMFGSFNPIVRLEPSESELRIIALHNAITKIVEKDRKWVLVPSGNFRKPFVKLQRKIKRDLERAIVREDNMLPYTERYTKYKDKIAKVFHKHLHKYEQFFGKSQSEINQAASYLKFFRKLERKRMKELKGKNPNANLQ